MANENIVNFKERLPGGYSKFIRFGLFLIGCIVLLIAVFSSVFIVQENEYKVVRQFGEVVNIIEKPGLHTKIPLVQSVSSLPKYQMTYDVKEAEINTKDKKRMIIDNYAVWKIEDPKKMISNARNMVNAEAKMAEFVFSSIRSELGQLNYDEIINDEKSSRGSLNDKVTALVNEALERDQYGITVTDVRIKRTDLPEANEKSVYTRMISERDSTAQEYLSKGDADKNRMTAKADKLVKETIAKAESEADVIRGQGEQEAAKIYNKAYSADSGFYGLYRTLESYKKTIDGETVIIIPFDSPYAQTLLGKTN